MNRATRDALIVGILALLVRIPAFFAPQSLGFDDGQFAMSVIAMRHGGAPFRQVFSSQGPLFLPIAWLGDLLTFRGINSPRAASVVAGVVLTVLVLLIARRLTSPGAALLTAVLVALSGSVLWTSGPLTSDGIGAALTAGTVLAALEYWRSPSVRRALLIGVLAGCALAVKSLLVIPGLVAAGLWMLMRRRGRDLVVVPVVAVATVLLVSLPWGLSRVYDQYVRYHTDAVASRPIGANASKLVRTLFERDAPLLAAGIIGVLAAVALVLASRRSRVDAPVAALDGAKGEAVPPRFPIAVWLVATVFVVLTESPMWRNHVAHVVVPLALLVGVALVSTRMTALAATVALLVAPWSIVHLGEVLRPQPPSGRTAVLEPRLRALPRGALVISDTPGLVWRAGRRVPDRFVDVSILRITSPTASLRLTGDHVVHAAARPDVCAVVQWSDQRFTHFPHLDARLKALGYRATLQPARGPEVLWVKRDCKP
jgi:4-amino-4-deoxy-L-arabinose transferase and related glycosyltransferases of PMT family